MATVLPMFPLGTALLPGGVLPLHVFEPRYRQLVQDLLAGEPEFGVALIEKGSEVGGGDQRSQAGTVARLVQVAEMPDGRYAIVCVGTRRIRVERWLPDDPYPVAEVDDWPDESVGPGELDQEIAAALRRVRRVVAMAVELGVSSGAAPDEVSSDPILASYQLCGVAPLGPADRQRLLTAAGPAARLRSLDELLDDVEAVLRFRLLPPSEPEHGSS